MKSWEWLVLIVVLLLLCGCASTKEYYPPDKETRIEVKDKEGNVIEVRGALKSEVSKFTLGTQGLGNYQLVTVSGLNF